jgi:acyl dehydratase
VCVPASRTFSAEDQSRFAALSGDFNPIHIDALAARRTLAGAPIVHGTHLLLWLLECIAAEQAFEYRISAMRFRFRGMVYIGDRVEARLEAPGPQGLHASAFVNDAEVLRVTLTTASELPAATPHAMPAGEPEYPAARPCEPTLEEMARRSGVVCFPNSSSAYAERFPGASRLISSLGVATLGCSSYLVGMVVPGLHSIYHQAELRFSAPRDRLEVLRFQVTSVDPRFRRALIDIAAPGVDGSLTTEIRPAPVNQPSIVSIAPMIRPGEFVGQLAMVVGGSRGLGETTAKIIAAGRGKVIVTYAQGASDAARVAAEINNWGGDCEPVAYDVRADALQQLRQLRTPPTHFYYFATPTISRRRSTLLAPALVESFNAFYVRGFLDLVNAARQLRPQGLSVFYPSSVHVPQRPLGMIEYAMSKAAGEALCVDIGRSMPEVRLLVERLPPLLTDQTAAVIQDGGGDPLQIMLPIVRRLQQ